MIQKAIFVVTVCCIAYITCGPTRQSGHGHGSSQSDCERRRDREARVNISSRIVIECNEDGSYKPLQCFGETVSKKNRFCACYDNEYNQIKGPSTKLKSCNCVRQHHELTSQRGQAQAHSHVPRCNDVTGEYQLTQCNETKHWCVDSNTGVKIGEERDGGCSAAANDDHCSAGH